MKADTLAGDWRGADASALDARIKAIEDWLDHSDNLLEMFEDDRRVATDLRSLAGVLRTRRNDFQQKSEALRAQKLTREGDFG